VEDDSSTASERVQPEVVQQTAPPQTDVGDGSHPQEQVARPTKLIRIASMVRNMLEEVRRAPVDDAGRRALREIHERSIHELEDVLSPDLKEELCEVVLPFKGDAPSESELRLAQAQLVGWLEGLFHGIQTALFAQQMAARVQLEQMRRGALPPGAKPGEQHELGMGRGQYL
jgi:Bacterial proteasome activator